MNVENKVVALGKLNISWCFHMALNLVMAYIKCLNVVVVAEVEWYHWAGMPFPTLPFKESKLCISSSLFLVSFSRMAKTAIDLNLQGFTKLHPEHSSCLDILKIIFAKSKAFVLPDRLIFRRFKAYSLTVRVRVKLCILRKWSLFEFGNVYA